MLASSDVHIARAATLVLPCLLIAEVTTTKYLLTPGRFRESENYNTTTLRSPSDNLD